MTKTGFCLIIAATVVSTMPFASERTAAQPKNWCAPPRIEEPLMKDAVRIGTANDARSVLDRQTHGIAQVPRESIRTLSDDSLCRQAAGAYAAILRESVDKTTVDKPVLVIRVGKAYFVDDLRSRQGRGAYWEAMVFDEQWHRLWGYGAGA